MNRPEIKSVTALKTFTECPQKFFWQYVERLTPKAVGSAFMFGRWAHEWLEAYYKGEDVDARLAKIVQDTEVAVTGPSEAERASEALAMLIGMADAYKVWAPKHDANFKVLSVESEGYHEGIYCRRDAVVEVLSGPNVGIWPMEHKTHGLGFGQRYEELAPFETQALTEVAITPGARGIMYNLIGKPAIRQRKAEQHKAFTTRMAQEYNSDPDKYFQRRFIPMGGKLGASGKIFAARLTLDVYLSAGLKKFPQNTEACFSHGVCPFLALCQGKADPDDLFNRRP